jgi:uncharacterized membrane protein YeaQ/YmgE (transglycosylase-associated protein family)
MTILELVVYLCIAALCGAVARAVAGGTRGGFVISLFVGFLGAFIGTWLARMFHLPVVLAVAIDGHPFPVVWSILGGMLLVTIAHVLTRPSWSRRAW